MGHVFSFPNYIKCNGLFRAKVVTKLSSVEGQIWDGDAEAGEEHTVSAPEITYKVKC